MRPLLVVVLLSLCATGARAQCVEEEPELSAPPDALWAAAQSCYSVARYERAAAHFETFARRFPANVDTSCERGEHCMNAREGLQTAISLRLGLGQTDEAGADVQLFDRYYRRRVPRECAELSHSMGALLVRAGNHRAIVRHYNRWLRTYDRVATIPLRLAARLELAGALAELGRAQEARPHLEETVRIGDSQTSPEPRDPVERQRLAVRRRSAIAEARVRLAEPRVETFLSTRPPPLGDDPNRYASAQLDPWIMARAAEILELEQELNLVADYEIPEWSIAASELLGRLFQHVLDRVSELLLPSAIEGRRTSTFRQRATNLYEFCAATATQVRWVSATSQRCFEALDELRQRPAPHELAAGVTFENRDSEPGPASEEDGLRRLREP